MACLQPRLRAATRGRASAAAEAGSEGLPAAGQPTN